MAKASQRAARAPAEAQRGWRFPDRLVSQGTRLLTQQCWYWGCDVRRAEGNRLLASGFTRTRPPEGAPGSTAYAIEPAPGAQITLWSFGVFYGGAGVGGLFLDRFRCDPRLLDAWALPPTVWQVEQLPALHRPAEGERRRLAALLGPLLRWIIGYEHAVLVEHGPAYREACLAAWSRRGLALPATAVASEWERFSEACDAALAAVPDLR